MTAIIPSITEKQVFNTLRAFLLTVVDCEVIRLPANRASMPVGAFVAMSPGVNVPLSTNVAGYADSTKTTARASQFSVQIDCYGAGSSERATAISMLLRDVYACEQFAASGYDIQPLYAGDAKQLPLVDGEQQYEERWTFDAALQFNPAVTTPQDSANALTIDTIDVDRTYPP